MKPTDQQKLIIDSSENAVVIAAPGSGKTYVLSQKIKKDLINLLDHQGVIAISYTNKASTELKNRSLSNGENPKCSFFGTIDKFNISEIIIPFAKHLFGLPKNDFKVIKKESLTEKEQENLCWINRTLNLDELDEEKIDSLKRYFLNGIIIIDSIGVLAHYVFTNSLSCRNYIMARYQTLYIDEYQDSGLNQHQLFLKIKTLNILAVVVGDLNQSIYKFSGKDAKYLKDLTRDSNFKNFKLNKNHRCHPSIINYSNYLLDRNTTSTSVENKKVFYKKISGNESDIASWINTKIETLKKYFKIDELREIAILTRGLRSGQIINNNLTIPHKHYISNELDINLNIWSGIFSHLLSYIFDNEYKFIDVIEVFTTYEKFNSKELKQLNRHKNDLNIIITESECNLVKLKSEFIKIASIIAPNSKSKESIELLDLVLEDSKSFNSYKPPKNNEINIMTLHKSKGLEFDLIIHLDLYEWVFPNKQPGPNNDFDNLIYGDWEQDLNLHYVGVTRARKGCILISSTKRTNNNNEIKNGKESEFLNLYNIKNLRYGCK